MVLCGVGFGGLLVAPAVGVGAWAWAALLGLGQDGAINLSLRSVRRSPDARHTARVSTAAQETGSLLAGL